MLNQKENNQIKKEEVLMETNKETVEIKTTESISKEEIVKEEVSMETNQVKEEQNTEVISVPEEVVVSNKSSNTTADEKTKILTFLERGADKVIRGLEHSKNLYWTEEEEKYLKCIKLRTVNTKEILRRIRIERKQNEELQEINQRLKDNSINWLEVKELENDCKYQLIRTAQEETISTDNLENTLRIIDVLGKIK